MKKLEIGAIRLVQASVDDAQKILEIKLRAFSKEHEFYGLASVPPLFDSLDRQIETISKFPYFYKVMNESGIIGGALVIDLGEGKLYLSSLYVDLDYQNQGVGSQVMKALENLFPQARQWTLETPYLSRRNHHFYEKHGFKKVGEHQPQHAVDSDFRLLEYEKKIQTDTE